MLGFSHSGKIGDLIYSLNFCKACSDNAQFDFNIQINQKHQFNTLERDDIMLSMNAAKYIKPLLNSQPYIRNVTINEKVPDKFIDLIIFKKHVLNLSSGDLRSFYYEISPNFLDMDFSIPIIKVDADYSLKNKVIVVLSERYVPAKIDFKELEPFKDSLVLIGTKQEHERFEKKYFNIEYRKVENALQFARLAKGSKGVLSNLNGNYAIAEQMKIPRILLWPDVMKIEYSKNEELVDKVIPGPMNVIPQGGICNTATSTQRTVGLLKHLLRD